jgi:hypothetical protein
MQFGTPVTDPTPAPGSEPAPGADPGAVRLWDEGLGERDAALQPRQDQALAQRTRAQIVALEQALRQLPGAVVGDSDLCPLKHTFADGIYVREIWIPKGTVLTGKIHKHAHPNVLLHGEVLVVTEAGGREHLTAPRSMISQPGTKRAVVALEDTVWITLHANPDNTRDLAVLEEQIIAPDYEAFEAFQAAQRPAPGEETL